MGESAASGSSKRYSPVSYTQLGAGQWGTALAMACAHYGLDLTVYMVKVSYEQKPFRKAVIHTFGANIIPSPSDTTEVGRQILAAHPGTGGSLGLSLIHI